MNVYSGSATLLVSGTFSLNGSSKLCALVSGSSCDFTNWNPNTNMPIVGSRSTGVGVAIGSGAQNQGGIYAAGSVTIGPGATLQGPMIAGIYSVSDGVTLKPFPTITTLPVSSPGNPSTTGAPYAPVYAGR